ncbi:hypothetical protein A2U01_0106795, partial [Trifolium medium]|nr:hypothetical protein [Trifolium medium]
VHPPLQSNLTPHDVDTGGGGGAMRSFSASPFTPL